MADPLSIVGAISSLAGIIDVLGKSIRTIRDLRGEWKDADLTVLNRVAQLVALKAALIKIQEWKNNELVGPHHQLVMDLEFLIKSSGVLAEKVDAELSKLHINQDGVLDKSAKIRMVVWNNMEGLAKMIERQTAALNLLLSVCHRSIPEQRALLEKSSSRKILNRVEKDSASLIAHRDTASLVSRCTDNLSKLSLVFGFDGELFLTKVYDRAHRASVKATLRRQQYDTTSVKNRISYKKNEEIEKTIRADRKTQGREVKILLLGAGGSDKSEFFHQMRMIHSGGMSKSEREKWRASIFYTIFDAFKILLDAEFKNDDSLKCAEFFRSDPNLGPDDPFPLRYFCVFFLLWADNGVHLTMLRRNEYVMHDKLNYFLEHLDRLFAPGYVPTNQDIVRAQKRLTGIYETIFDSGALTYRIVDVGAQRLERKKWKNTFDNVQVVLFTVAISCYDQTLVEDRSGNQMTESLMLFDRISNSTYFTNSSIIIFFTKKDLFREKISSGMSPVHKYFPDYQGTPTDVSAAQEFFSTKFKNVVRQQHKEIYVYFVNSTDSDIFKKLEDSVKDMSVGRKSMRTRLKNLIPTIKLDLVLTTDKNILKRVEGR